MRAAPLLTALIASAAFAAAPPSSRRHAALIVPMDKASEALALKAEGFVVDSLREFGGIDVKTSDDLFGVSPDEDAQASLKRAEQGFDESRAAFEEKAFDDAERKLRATMKEFGKAAPALKACGHLCDAVAMYAAVLQARGDVEESKIAILDLISLNPKFELDKKRYSQDFVTLKTQVQSSRNAMMRGGVALKTRPAGARVYLNGEFQGYTPYTLQTLPVGKSLVRLERPGFKQVGALVEVTPEDQELSFDLSPTSAYRAYDGLMDRIATEALKNKSGSALQSVSSSMKLDRAIVGVLKELEPGGAMELTLCYMDLKRQERLTQKRASFQGDEYGQLKGEVGRMVNALINNAEAPSEAKSRSSDPLENRAGTEDWSGEDKGGKTTQAGKKKKKAKDPLEGMSGTEDW